MIGGAVEPSTQLQWDSADEPGMVPSQGLLAEDHLRRSGSIRALWVRWRNTHWRILSSTITSSGWRQWVKMVMRVWSRVSHQPSFQEEELNGVRRVGDEPL